MASVYLGAEIFFHVIDFLASFPNMAVLITIRDLLALRFNTFA